MWRKGCRQIALLPGTLMSRRILFLQYGEYDMFYREVQNHLTFTIRDSHGRTRGLAAYAVRGWRGVNGNIIEPFVVYYRYLIHKIKNLRGGKNGQTAIGKTPLFHD